MAKSRSGQLINCAAVRYSFSSPDAKLSILRRQNPFCHRKEHKMNNFCLCPVFVRAALISRRLELSCDTRTGAMPQKIVETPASSGACLPFMRPKSYFTMGNQLVMNHLSLFEKKVEISGLMRPAAKSRPQPPTPFPQPTPHNPQPAPTTSAPRALFPIPLGRFSQLPRGESVG